MININLNDDNKLYLNRSEAEMLALDLEAELVGTTDDGINVADVSLIKADGWKLLDKLRNTVESVNWKVEGF